MVRLIPINTLAVLLACAAARDWDIPLAATHLLFLENYVHYAGHWIPVISTNGNLWSLNHEVVYYTMFIAIWWARPRLSVALAFALVVLLLGWFTPFLPVFVACYAAGSLFWISGLALAWNSRKAEREGGAWPSALLLALITWKLHMITQLLLHFPKSSVGGPTVRLYDVDFVPVTVWIVAIVSGRTSRFVSICRGAAIVIPGVGLLVRWHSSGASSESELMVIAGVYLGALLLLRWRPSVEVFRRIAPLGAISFALYAFARPIQSYVFSHVPALPANGFGFVAASALVVGMAASLAYFAELRVQPELQRRFVQRRVACSDGPGVVPPSARGETIASTCR
jgi:peptidoglycan/LPS O-acetylase OafA/YrhL